LSDVPGADPERSRPRGFGGVEAPVRGRTSSSRCRPPTVSTFHPGRVRDEHGPCSSCRRPTGTPPPRSASRRRGGVTPEDQHVLGRAQPSSRAMLEAIRRAKALLAHQRVAAVNPSRRSRSPWSRGKWTMYLFLVVAGPGHLRPGGAIGVDQRVADRMEAGGRRPRRPGCRGRPEPIAGHESACSRRHRASRSAGSRCGRTAIRGGPWRNGTTYIVRPRIDPLEQTGHGGPHLGRLAPVVGRGRRSISRSLQMKVRSSTRATVGGNRSGPGSCRAGGHPDSRLKGPVGHQQLAEPVVFLLAAVRTSGQASGCKELATILDEVQQGLVCRRGSHPELY